MNLIISTTNYKHQNFTVSKTVRNIEWEGVKSVIFNDSVDSELDTILGLAEAFTKVEKFIYINDNLHSLFVGLLMGMNGDIYNDSTLLRDEDTLSFLISDYKNTGMTIKTADADVETLVKLITTLSNENAETLEKLIKNGFWLKTIESSVNNVGNELVRTGQANKTMVEIFNRTSDMVKHFSEESTKLQQEIDSLNKTLDDAEKNYGKGSMQSTPYIFPTYQVPTTIPRVLYVRVYSPCRFLLTFLNAYQHYLKMEKRINSKMLISVPKLKQFLIKYDKLPRLDAETVNNLNIGSLGDTLVTFEPRSTVLNSFFNMKTDLYIVVDMMYGDNLIAGYKVEQVNAITSLSDIETFRLTNDRTIVSLRGMNSNIVIPYIKTVNSKVPATSVYTYYNELCNDKAYAKLNNIIFGRG